MDDQKKSRLFWERRTPLEQHVVSILVTLIAAGVLWIGSSIVDIRTQLAGLAEKFALKSEVAELRSRVDRIAEEQQRRTIAIDRVMRDK